MKCNLNELAIVWYGVIGLWVSMAQTPPPINGYWGYDCGTAQHKTLVANAMNNVSDCYLQRWPPIHNNHSDCCRQYLTMVGYRNVLSKECKLETQTLITQQLDVVMNDCRRVYGIHVDDIVCQALEPNGQMAYWCQDYVFGKYRNQYEKDSQIMGYNCTDDKWDQLQDVDSPVIEYCLTHKWQYFWPIDPKNNLLDLGKDCCYSLDGQCVINKLLQNDCHIENDKMKTNENITQRDCQTLGYNVTENYCQTLGPKHVSDSKCVPYMDCYIKTSQAQGG